MLCKFCYSHDNMRMFHVKHYYDMLPYGKTTIDCEACGDTYEYEKDHWEKVTERLVIR